MKKILSSLILSLAVVSFTFAKSKNQSLIDAALKDDFATFKELIESGTKANQKTPSGLNVPCALAYFSTENFEKACALLSSKKVNLDEPTKINISLLHLLAYSNDYKKMEILLKYKPDVNRREKATNLLPIDFTQFSTYKYVSNQVISEDTMENAQKCRELLLAAGSESFKYCPPQIQYIGNFYTSLVTLAVAFNNKVDMRALRSAEFFDVNATKERTIQTFKYDKIPQFMKIAGANASVENYRNWQEITDMLQNNSDDSSKRCLILQFGNNKLAPHQWAIFQTFEDLNEEPSSESFIKVGNPDSKFSFVNFQLKDVSQIILIKFE